jgi:MFS family permease
MTIGASGIELPPVRPAPAIGFRGGVGLFVILSSISFNMLLVVALLPVMSMMAASFGGGAHGQLIAQTLETMSNIGILVGGPIAGAISDRIGRANVLFFALAIYGITGSAGLVLDYPPALLASRLLQGFGAAGIAV